MVLRGNAGNRIGLCRAVLNDGLVIPYAQIEIKAYTIRLATVSKIWPELYTPIRISLNRITALTTGIAKKPMDGSKLGKELTITTGRITIKYDGPI